MNPELQKQITEFQSRKPTSRSERMMADIIKKIEEDGRTKYEEITLRTIFSLYKLSVTLKSEDSLLDFLNKLKLNLEWDVDKTETREGILEADVSPVVKPVKKTKIQKQETPKLNTDTWQRGDPVQSQKILKLRNKPEIIEEKVVPPVSSEEIVLPWSETQDQAVSWKKESPVWRIKDVTAQRLKEGKDTGDQRLNDFFFNAFHQRFFRWNNITSLYDGTTVDIQKNKAKIVKNMEVFFSFIMDTESDFRNIANQWIWDDRTTAKWGIQYVDETFNRARNRSKRVLKTLGIDSKYSQSFLQDISSAKSLLDVSTKAEILFFFLDNLDRAKDDDQLRNGEPQTTNLGRLLINTIIFGDPTSMRVFYRKYHHTNTDPVTEKRMREKLVIYWKKLDQTIVSKNESIPIHRELSLLFDNARTLRKGRDNADAWDRIQTLQRVLWVLWFQIEWVKLWEETQLFWSNMKSALIRFQIQSGIIEAEDSPGAGIFWPNTRAVMKEKIISKVTSVLSNKDSSMSSEDILKIFKIRQWKPQIIVTEPVVEEKPQKPKIEEKPQEVYDDAQDILKLKEELFCSISVKEKDKVILLQKMLIALGFSPKDPSGKGYSVNQVTWRYGKATVSALEEYSSSKGITTTAPKRNSSECFAHDFLENIYEDFIALPKEKRSSIFIAPIQPKAPIIPLRIRIPKYLDTILDWRITPQDTTKVLLIQKILISLGFPPEKSNGEKYDSQSVKWAYGEATIKALQKFSQDKGITISLPPKGSKDSFPPNLINTLKEEFKKTILWKNEQDLQEVYKQISLVESIPIVDYAATNLSWVGVNLFWKRPNTSIISSIYKKRDNNGNPLFVRNYTRRVKPFYNTWGVPGNVRDFSAADKLLEAGQLVFIERETNLWKLDSSILGKSRDKKGLLYLTPYTKKILLEITREFQRKLREDYKLQNGWNVRVILNSLLRPTVYNSKIKGSSKQSAHIRGIGFDIAHNRFEVYKWNEYVRVTNIRQDKQKVWVDVNIAMTQALVSVLYEVLDQFDSQWKIIFTKEWSHPHITVKENKDSSL